jgi:hypothetical protein
MVKQSGPSGKKGEDKGNPRKVWSAVFPGKSAIPKGCKVLSGPDFLIWLSKKGISFHNSTEYDPNLKSKSKTKCTCGEHEYKKEKDPLSSGGIVGHIRGGRHEGKLEKKNVGLFFAGKRIVDSHRTPDHVVVCDNGKEIYVFENKNIDSLVGGSTEEKPATAPFNLNYWEKVVAVIGWKISNFVLTCSGERLKLPLAQTFFEEQAKWCVSQSTKLVFLNLEDGKRIP